VKIRTAPGHKLALNFALVELQLGINGLTVKEPLCSSAQMVKQCPRFSIFGR